MFPSTPSMFSSFEQHLTVSEVAKLMACSNEHVVKLYDDGELVGIDIARRASKHRELRFSHTDLDHFELQRKSGRDRVREPRRQRTKRMGVKPSPISDDIRRRQPVSV